jgi:hypothetical protein
MTQFVFGPAESLLQQTPPGIDLSLPVYACLVEVTPASGFSQRSQLDEPEDSSYVIQSVTKTFASNALTLTQPVIFPPFATAETVVGAALCVQVGGSPATTDPVIWYSANLEANTTIISAPVAPQTYGLRLRPPSTPIIEIGAADSRFPSGIQTFPIWSSTNGIFYMLRTSNYTNIPGSAPNPNKVTFYSGSAAVIANPERLIDRNSSDSFSSNLPAANNSRLLIDFYGNGGAGSAQRKILLNKMALRWSSTGTGVSNLRIAVSDSLPDLLAATVQNDAWYEFIGGINTITNAVAATNSTLTFTPPGTRRWMLIDKETLSGTNHVINLIECELPECEITSPSGL